MVALYQPEGTVVERFDRCGSRMLKPHTVRMNNIRLMYPEQAHSVVLFFDGGTGVPPWYQAHFDWPEGNFRGWKIDLQSPFQRTVIGFDATDNALDVIVRPDFSWYWKDEDGLAQRAELGVFTPDEAEAFYAEGRRVIQRVEERRSPFCDPWPQWRPDQSWTIPLAPAGWEAVPGIGIDLNRNSYREMQRFKTVS